MTTKFFDSIIMLRFLETKAKQNFIVEKTPIKIWYIDGDNIVTSKVTGTNNISNYLIGYFDDSKTLMYYFFFVKALTYTLILGSKMGGYVKSFKEKNNELMSLRIDDEKVLEQYKAIWTKIIRKY